MGVEPFVKIYGEILDSSVWEEPLHIRVAWIGMLTLCNENGVVPVPTRALHKRIGLSKEEMNEALEIFQAPDPQSRSTIKEGRRIELVAVEHGAGEECWQIINYERYRKIRTAKQAKNAEYQRTHRQKVKNSKKGDLISSDIDTEVEVEVEGEVEGDVDKETTKEKKKKEKSPFPQSEFEYFVSTWNRMATESELPTFNWQDHPTGKLKAIKTNFMKRMSESGFKAQYMECVLHIGKCPGRTVRGKDGTWYATFPWLMQRGKMDKAFNWEEPIHIQQQGEGEDPVQHFTDGNAKSEAMAKEARKNER